MDPSQLVKETIRVDTPVAELDDHRDVDTNQHHHSHSNARKMSETPAIVNSPIAMSPRIPPGHKNLIPLKLDTTPHHAPIARDFENAIIDDDTPDHLVVPNEIPNRRRSRRGFSVDPEDAKMRSRDSSSSARSSSPPNSVDAFAEPRRRGRAATITSRAGDREGSIIRTVSGGTHQRRPTFDNGSFKVPTVQLDEPEFQQEDTAYPETERNAHKTFTIDFEEIDEFVAEHTRKVSETTPVPGVRNGITIQLPAPRIGPSPALSGVEKYPSLNMMSTDSSTTSDDIPMQKIGVKGKVPTIDDKRFSFFSSENEQIVHAPEMGSLVEPGETFRDLFELPPESGAWWLDVMNPTPDELEMFQKAFNIHRLTIEDIERQEIREKVELFQKYYFVCFRSFHQMDVTSEDYLDPLNVYMVVFREGILTFTYGESPHGAFVRKRISKLRNFINLTADWICYALIDNIVDCFQPPLSSIEHEADTIDDNVFTTRDSDMGVVLRQIGECRKRVMQLMRLLGGKADVIKGFAKRCNEQYSVTPRGEIGLYLGDIQDHVVTMMSSLNHFESMLSRSQANYLAQLSFDNLVQGNVANKAIAKITLIATVVVPLNIVCGLMGMNVGIPGGTNGDSFQTFGIVIAFMVGFVVISLLVFRRFKWI